MKNSILEFFIGFLVVLTSIYFAIFQYSKVYDGGNFYLLKAKFQTAEGITVGTDINLSGVKVGRVYQIELNDFAPIVTFEIKKDIKIPKDSVFSVGTQGIIGPRVINISPGADEETLSYDDLITQTQSGINLESIISKILVNIGSK